VIGSADAFCRAFAHEYDSVAVCHRRRPGVASRWETLVDPLQPRAPLLENADRVHILTADLEREHELDRVVDVALARFVRVDLLVKAAA
jgi:NAD(P)-dependent dehydrogenase (short-subunit alcohol dehydrogenase family)